MSSVPMPKDLSEEAVAEWLWRIFSEDVHPGFVSPWDEQVGWRRTSHERTARAVRSLVEQKVREAVVRTNADARDGKWIIADEVVARVMGDHPQGGHGEGRPARGEAPRG